VWHLWGTWGVHGIDLLEEHYKRPGISPQGNTCKRILKAQVVKRKPGHVNTDVKRVTTRCKARSNRRETSGFEEAPSLCSRPQFQNLQNG
jgi:hypothetical protein